MQQEDILRRFVFEDLGVRGLWVRLATSWQTARQHQQCPEVVQLQLGQALAAVVMLSSTIKFKGSLILQAQGEGPITTLVAQATHDLKIRCLAKSHEVVEQGTLPDMFGDGRLVITVSSENAQPYQGVVLLQGNDLSFALENYFAQSEQLNTRIWLASDKRQATGLLIQQLPSYNQPSDDWNRIVMLASTVTQHELQSLTCETMLYRLFNEENVRLYEGEPVSFDCSCSRSKIENALRMLGREELDSVLVERDLIEVNCEFCNRHYHFDKVDVEQLLRRVNSSPEMDNRLRH